ncbi:hypothetical protein EPN52_05475 [bacterium]|nr:MAG: hypothetical protein EPN52_05475 [bacterium]
MASNIARTILGLLLVYASVLDQHLVLAPAWTWLGSSAGLIVIALSLWSRSLDYHPWHANTTLTMGVFLLAATLIERFVATPSAAVTWIVFWTGLLIAFFALWAALYHPAAGVTAEE